MVIGASPSDVVTSDAADDELNDDDMDDDEFDMDDEEATRAIPIILERRDATPFKGKVKPRERMARVPTDDMFPWRLQQRQERTKKQVVEGGEGK